MKKFYVDQCPDDLTVHSWITNNTDIEYYIKNMKPKNKGTLFEFEDRNIDISKVQSKSEELFDEFGWFGMLNILGEGYRRGKAYGGLSLVYNPSYIDSKIPINAQTLGYPKRGFPDEIFRDNIDIFKKVIAEKIDKKIWQWSALGTHKLYNLLYDYKIINSTQLKNLLKLPDVVHKVPTKNTYTDTWGFNRWTKPATYLSEITNRVKRSPVRSRLAKIKKVTTEDQRNNLNKYLWHRDTSWFYELRLNLSIETHKNYYGIEIENYGKTAFVPGRWYVWDTDFTHRPYIDKIGYTRTNYVLAVNPWFDFNEKENCWIQNRFYGNKHPLDMVVDGDVLEGIHA